MSSTYAERIRENQALTEGLRVLSPDLVAVELFREGRECIDGLPDSRRIKLEPHYLALTNPVIRDTIKSHRQEEKLTHDAGQLVDEIEDWLTDLTTDQPDESEEEEDYPYESHLDPLRDYKTEADHIDWEAIRRSNAREKESDTLKQIGVKLAEADFGISFGENIRGLKWNEACTLGNIWDILVLQKQLGMPVATDQIRELLKDIKPINRSISIMTTDYLIENAYQGRDRESFIIAGNQFSEYVKEKDQPLAPSLKLTELGIEFIKQAKPEIDREVLDITLTVLPYYDRMSLNYAFLCAKLGVALRD